MSHVQENRENRLKRPSSGQTPMSTAPDAERIKGGSLPRVGYGTCARWASDAHAAGPRGAW